MPIKQRSFHVYIVYMFSISNIEIYEADIKKKRKLIQHLVSIASKH